MQREPYGIVRRSASAASAGQVQSALITPSNIAAEWRERRQPGRSSQHDRRPHEPLTSFVPHLKPPPQRDCCASGKWVRPLQRIRAGVAQRTVAARDPWSLEDGYSRTAHQSLDVAVGYRVLA